MSSNQESERTKPSRAWSRIVALLVLVALVLAELYYKSHPHLLKQQLGTLGVESLAIGMGCYLLLQAAMGVRNGSIAGTYTPSHYKRSENPPMFWFLVVSDGAFGIFGLVAGFGLLFGLLH